ncbi:MAG TPA: Uma2 family endonuclease [Pyrinomonadaceae bacterium]|nr:Uma2 family endonuclease [Pyrinomonadaceae bacterium]
MSHQPVTTEPSTPAVLALNVQSMGLTDEQFEKLCQDNPDLRIELTSKGELIIMPPTGMKTGWRNSKITGRLLEWTEKDGSGLSFDSSTLFTLPDGSKRSPDALWIRGERVEKLSQEEQAGFAAIVPDFVIELRSPSDRWPVLEEKMLDYMRNGVQLAWLIDPTSRRVYIYRPNRPVETLDNPETVSAQPELATFTFNVQEIW